MRIPQLSADEQSEQLITPDLYQTKPKWIEAGCHHISNTLFRDEHFVAVGDMREDNYLNTLLLAYYKVIN